MDGWSLWMAYTCNMKRKFEDVAKMGRKVNVKVNVPCIIDQDYKRWAIVVNHTSKFKAI